jgi:hypothetical protein
LFLSVVGFVSGRPSSYLFSFHLISHLLGLLLHYTTLFILLLSEELRSSLKLRFREFCSSLSLISLLLFSLMLTFSLELRRQPESSTTVITLLVLQIKRLASGLTLFLGSKGVSQPVILML